MNKAIAIMHLFPDADPFYDFEVRDDGDGVQFIAKWDIGAPEPSEEELEAAYADWEAEQASLPPVKTSEQRIAELEAKLAIAAQAAADANDTQQQLLDQLIEAGVL